MNEQIKNGAEHQMKYSGSVKLENIRMLYGFMEELEYQLKYSDDPGDQFEDKHYVGKGGLYARNKILEDIESKLTFDFLERSDFKKYCDFWESYFGESPISGTANQALSRMFHFYHTAHDLQWSKDRKHDTLPYRYEDICITIAEMTGYDMCHILYKNGDSGDLQTVSQSGFLYEGNQLKYVYDANEALPAESGEEAKDRSTVLDGGFQNEAFMRIVKDVDDFVNTNDMEEKEVVIPNSVFTSIGLKKYSYICLRIPLMLRGAEPSMEERRFYVVLAKWDQSKVDKAVAVSVAARVLFMRDTLSDILRRDYATLLNFRYNCEYIQSVDASFDRKKDFPQILHISDLHISKSQEIWVERADIFVENQKPIDLLAITGDIICGSREAAAAQTKYKYAADYITQWAILLWGVNGRLPHDWRRRIMITTGNHDYMTMNELMSSSENRETKFGEPSKDSGGTMVKFTYFIEILQQWLDAPAVRLIKHDLNEYRYYKNLNLRVLILNSISGANVHQNNKVRLNWKITDELSKCIWGEEDESYRICLLHHEPNYQIDYLSDGYEWYRYFNAKNTKEKREMSKKSLDTIKKQLEKSPPEGKKEEYLCQSKEHISTIRVLDKLTREIKQVQEYMIAAFLKCCHILASFGNTELSWENHFQFQEFIWVYTEFTRRKDELSSFKDRYDHSPIRGDLKKLIESEVDNYEKSLLCSDMKTIYNEIKKIRDSKEKSGYRGNNEVLHKSMNRLLQWYFTQKEDQLDFSSSLNLINKHNKGQKNIMFLAGHVHHCGRKYYTAMEMDEQPFVVGQAKNCYAIVENENKRVVKYRQEEKKKRADAEEKKADIRIIKQEDRASYKEEKDICMDGAVYQAFKVVNQL